MVLRLQADIIHDFASKAYKILKINEPNIHFNWVKAMSTIGVISSIYFFLFLLLQGSSWHSNKEGQDTICFHDCSSCVFKYGGNI